MIFQSENIKTGVVVIPPTKFCSKGDGEEEEEERRKESARKELNKPCLDNKE